MALRDWVQYFIEGFPVGCVYALVAIGLVLTYKTSGVFNLAFGAQAFMAAALMYKASEGWGWPPWLAFVVSVFIVSPLFGLLLDRALFRYMRNASWVVKLVSSLGLFVALPEIVKAVLTGVKPQFNAPSIAPIIGVDRLAGSGGVFHVGSFVIGPDLMTITIVTLVIVLLLGVLFRYTPLGLQMRAIVESFRMVELAGVDSERVSMSAWMLSSFLAGLAGVMLAPLVSIDPNPYTLLLVAAVAAAAFGRLTSIPLALLGGLILGIGQRAIIGLSYHYKWPQDVQNGVRPALPFVALFLLLIFLPAFKGRRDVTDPLAGVDPPPPAMAHEYKDRSLAKASRAAFFVFIAAFLLLVCFAMSDVWVFRFTDAFTLAIAFLSITVFTGLGGQVSLGQAAFAGIGGYTTANFALNQDPWFGIHLPVLVALLVGVVFATVIGALLAVPGLRLGGIYLTLATLAFALMAQNIVFTNNAVSGGVEGLHVGRPEFLNGTSLLGADQRWFLFVFACFAVVGFLVIFVRSGTTGRFFAALRGSETAAAAIGINGTRQRILLFSLSAGIAGLAGGLIAMNAGRLAFDTQEYQALFGAAWVVLVVTLGSRTVDGAVNAALGFVIFQWLLGDYFNMQPSIALIGFGFGAITYARHPEGIVEFRTRVSILAQRKGALLRQRAADLETAATLPAGYIPGRRVTLPALAGPMALAAVIIVRRLTGAGEGVPSWVIAVCLLPSILFALTWMVGIFRRLVAHGASARGWLLLAVGTVVGGLVGWFLTSAHVKTPDFGSPEVLIDTTTWVGVVVGVACGFAIVAFFLLPVAIEHVARTRDFREPPVTWRDGRGPTLWIAIGAFLCYWASPAGNSWEPPFLWPLFLLGLIACIVMVQWMGAVQGAMNELALGEVEVAPGVPLAEDHLPEELPELAELAPTGGSDA